MYWFTSYIAFICGISIGNGIVICYQLYHQVGSLLKCFGYSPLMPSDLLYKTRIAQTFRRKQTLAIQSIWSWSTVSYSCLICNFLFWFNFSLKISTKSPLYCTSTKCSSKIFLIFVYSKMCNTLFLTLFSLCNTILQNIGKSIKLYGRAVFGTISM